MYPSDWIQVIHFWQQYQRSDTVPFSFHPVRWCLISLCPITFAPHFDHLIEVMSIRLPHCEVALFPSVINTLWKYQCLIHLIFFTQ